MADTHFGLPPFVDYTVDSCTNVSASSDKDNVKDDESIDVRMDLDDTTGFVMTIDLESLITDPIVCIDHCNFTGINLKGDDEATFTLPPVDSSVTIGTNDYSKWYDYSGKAHHYIYRHIWQLTEDVRYLRFTVSSQVATDGASAHYVGRIIVCSNVLSISQNPDKGLTYRTNTPVGINQRALGGRQYSKSKYKAWSGEFEWKEFRSANISEMQQLDLFPHELVVVWENIDSDPANFWVCNVTDEGITVSRDKPLRYSIGTRTFREVLI